MQAMDGEERAAEAKVQRSPRVSRRKVLVRGVILFGLLGAVGYILYVFSQPATGVITSTVATAPTAPEATPRTVKGKTATFRYPATIQAVKPDALAAGDVEKFLFIRSQLSAWSMATLVKHVPNNTFASDGSYNLRKQHPEQYDEEQSSINGMTVVIMADKQTSDKVAFILHDGLIAEIAVSGGDQNDTASDAAFTMVLHSWHWL